MSWDQLVFDFGEEVTTRRGIPRLLLTVKQAGLILSVGRTTTYELINAGELQVVHIGRSARVPLHSIEAVRRSPPRRSTPVRWLSHVIVTRSQRCLEPFQREAAGR